MKAKINSRSWEKQSIFNLENGWVATVEYNPCYGEFVSRLDSPNGKMWHCSNGSPERGGGADNYNQIFKTDKYVDLPDFAKDWVNEKTNLVLPKFERVY